MEPPKPVWDGISQPSSASAASAPGATWFISVSAFAVTVMATRVHLGASGNPKVGSNALQMVHMRWGGLVLVLSGAAHPSVRRAAHAHPVRLRSTA